MSTRPYLEPDDVSADNAALVLEFLNGATSAQQIADAVELPDELDIGLRLSQRILERRDQLGGFTDLHQVRAVPLIGPERFTEIVVTLSRQPLPTPPASDLDEIRSELARLEQRIAAPGGEARRLHLHIVNPGAFLGQPVTLVATLTDDGAPAVDVPITFVATRGAITSRDGYGLNQGHMVTARSDVGGVVRLTVTPTTREPLTPLQRDALVTNLGRLDTTVATPADAAEGLRELARQYAWEVNLPFRQAVDIYAREFQPNLLDTVTLRDNLAAWPTYDSAILAFAPLQGTGEDGSSVAATATAHLGVKDWIPPFLQAAVAQSREESPLADDLRNIAKGTSDSGRLVTAIYDRAGAFVASRWGNVGAWVGRKVAESTIRNFLDHDLAELPLDTRVDLFPALDVASRTMATADATVIQGLVNTRRDIEVDLDRRIGTLPGDFGAVAGRLDQLELQVKDTTTSLQADLGAIKLQLAGAVTTDQLTAAIEPLVTRDDLKDATTQFVTRDQLKNATTQFVTKDQLTAATSKFVTEDRLTEAIAPFITQDQLTLAIAPLITRDQLTSATASFVTRDQLTSATASFVTRDQLTSATASFVTRDQLTESLAAKVDTRTFNTFTSSTTKRFSTLDTSITKLDARIPR